MQNSLSKNLLISLKGIAMGAADVVPGVSGGTIAFITGIYDDLLEALKNAGGPAWLELKKGGIPAFWTSIKGTFLSFLFGGIAISIVSLAKLIHFLLNTYPLLVWSFFFGLILASAWLVAKSVDKWSLKNIISLLLGAVIAYLITLGTPAETPEGSLYIFGAGAIAICAMILPGISGSFILLLLGKYEFILSAVKSFNLQVIALFGAGCVIGLLSFSSLLSFLLKKYHGVTVSILTGFMLGALNKVWPWKQVLSTRINSKGEEVPFLEKSISPLNFEGDSQLLYCFSLAIFGIVLIVGIELIAQKFKPKQS